MRTVGEIQTLAVVCKTSCLDANWEVQPCSLEEIAGASSERTQEGGRVSALGHGASKRRGHGRKVAPAVMMRAECRRKTNGEDDGERETERE